MSTKIYSLQLLIITLLVISIFTSCKQNDKSLQEDKKVTTLQDDIITRTSTKPEDVYKDYKTWYSYTYYNIKLAQDFVGLHTDSSIISKEQFLNLLISGKYIAVEVYKKQQLPYYELFINKSNDKSIVNGIKQVGNIELTNYKKEGTSIPPIQLQDIAGNKYDLKNTNGKVTVLKCWFIRCVACVKEFPELNEMVDHYQERKDIQFISLALDEKEDLINFLEKKEFKYPVVADQRELIMDELKIQSFPTHIIVGKDGKIKKVVGSVEDLTAAIKKEVGNS